MKVGTVDTATWKLFTQFGRRQCPVDGAPLPTVKSLTPATTRVIYCSKRCRRQRHNRAAA